MHAIAAALNMLVWKLLQITEEGQDKDT